jgi:GTPase SAR1 family protein
MSISSLTVRTKPKYKLVLLGDQGVGKTSLISQFGAGRFEDSEAVPYTQ